MLIEIIVPGFEERKKIRMYEGKWTGSPPKGKITPRVSLGILNFGESSRCELLYWNTLYFKIGGFQVQFKEEGLDIKLFFSSESQAARWIDSDSLSQVVRGLYGFAMNYCKRHMGSTGTNQVWTVVEWDIL